MNEPITDLNIIAAQARLKADEHEAFRFYVEDVDYSDAELDALVVEMAQPIIRAIDCKSCANCCRVLDVYLTPLDAQKMAEGLFIPLSQIQTDYIDHVRAEAEGEWGVFQAKPCIFLKDKLCGIYEHRPDSCRVYPEFTPDFRWQTGHILEGYGLCPIIFNVIEALKVTLDW